MQSYSVGGANVDRLHVAVVQVLGAHNVRNQDENNFVVDDLFGFLGEEKSEKRNGGQPRNSCQRLGLGVFKETAHDVYFALAQADFLFDLALAYDRLTNA